MSGLAAIKKINNKKGQIIVFCQQMLELARLQKNPPNSPLSISDQFIEQATAFINRFERSKETDILEFLSTALEEDWVKAGLCFINDLKLNVNDECLKHAAEYNAKWAMFFDHAPPYQGSNFYTMSLSDQYSLLNKTIFQLLCKIFEVKPIAWSPLDNIDVLFNVIKAQKRPIKFGGFYGTLAYSKPCVNVVENFKDYIIKGWPKGSHKGKILNDGTAFQGFHFITVIGASKNKDKTKGQGYVYFLDSRIASEPNTPRVALKMSYEQFCDYCMDDLSLNLLVKNNHMKDSLPDGAWRGFLDYGYQRQGVTAAAEDELRVEIIANPEPTEDSLVRVQILPAYGAEARTADVDVKLQTKTAVADTSKPKSKLTREEFARLVEEGRKRFLAKAK